MERWKEKICAVVVTYNRKDLLQECLDALLGQTYLLDSIIIVDNASNDWTFEMLKENYLSNSIFDYFNTWENIWWAWGFHEWMKRAHEKGFDWFWIMDDDWIPKKDALEKILYSDIFNKQKEKISCMCSSVYLPNDEILFSHRNIMKSWYKLKNIYNFNNYTSVDFEQYSKKNFQVDNASFVWILIKNLVNQIWLPDKKLFIWTDDTDYTIKLRKVWLIYCIPESKFIHKEKIVVYDKAYWLFKIIPLNEYWKRLYMLRNLIYLLRVNKINNPFLYYWPIKLFFTKLFVAIMFEDKKYIRIKYLFIALINGFSKNMNNDFHPSKWNKIIK